VPVKNALAHEAHDARRTFQNCYPYLNGMYFGARAIEKTPRHEYIERESSGAIFYDSTTKEGLTRL
jgi:hypothetical protein